ncbi:MAG: hypothetical protein AseanaTS_28690 [Candidatus Pelagadaptatus aseana]|uniref:flagellar hook-length control protein FliK n=1 Tax=Candidatus Pelagadaptatus aseana TaxID=3120508 RepID=UPI0039B34B02
MTIDPTSLMGNAIKSLQTQQKQTIESIARVLNIRVGEVVSGTVTDISRVTPQTRQTLLDAYVARRSDPQTGNPARGYLSQQPETQTGNARQMALLQSPKLQLLQVVVQNQKLLTYSDLPLVKNQPVQLLLKSANQLEVLPGSTAAKTTTGTQPTPQQTTVQQALRANPVQQSNLQTVPARQLTELPTALQAIQLLNQLTQKLGNYSMQPLIAKDLQEALKNAANQIRTPEQLTKPAQLKQALRDSGVQLEARVRHQANLPAAAKSAENRLFQTNTPIKPEQLLMKSAPASPLQPRPLSPVAQQDVKGALLALLNRLQTATVAGEEVTTSSTHKAQTSQPQNTLLTILKTLLAGTPQLAQVKQEIPREALIQQLQQLVQQSLNKIQYRQLQTLNQQLAQGSELQTGQLQHWHLELPIRYGQEVHALSLQIDEEWRQINEDEPEQANSEERNDKKVRQWFVKLCFELPEAGYFHAHLTIVQNAVNASLWAENPVTQKKAEQQLNLLKQRLNKDGVEVKSLDCFPGKPPQQSNRLGYALVDIKT